MKLLADVQSEFVLSKMEEMSPVAAEWCNSIIAMLVCSLDTEDDPNLETDDPRLSALFEYVHRVLGTCIYNQSQGAAMPLKRGQQATWIREATFEAIKHIRDELPRLAAELHGAPPPAPPGETNAEDGG